MISPCIDEIGLWVDESLTDETFERLFALLACKLTVGDTFCDSFTMLGRPETVGPSVDCSPVHFVATGKKLVVG